MYIGYLEIERDHVGIEHILNIFEGTFEEFNELLNNMYLEDVIIEMDLPNRKQYYCGGDIFIVAFEMYDSNVIGLKIKELEKWIFGTNGLVTIEFFNKELKFNFDTDYYSYDSLVFGTYKDLKDHLMVYLLNA
ncbi:MAG: hypothetical protein ACRCW9_09700 [Cetobacterium sp.]